MLSRFSCHCAAIVFGYVALAGVSAFAQPAITGVVPASVKPGATVELKLSGTKLDGPLRVWTSFPARCEFVGHDPKAKDVKQVTCRVTMPAGASLGIGGVVIASINGISDVLPVMIDELPVVADNGNNRQPGSPQEVSLPVAIEGTGDGVTADYYAFAAKANDKVSIDLVSTRLGSDFDGVLRVLNAVGDELLLLDDDAAAGADCRGVFVAPAEGRYVIELRDNRFKGGGKYCLRLGSFPLITTAHPIGVRAGVPTPLSFVGPQIEGTSPISLLVGEGAAQRLPLSSGAGWTTVIADDLAVALESPGDKEALTPPLALHGVLVTGHEVDEYPIKLAKGERVTFRPISRSVGSPAIVTLRLLNAAGGQVAEAAISENEEESLVFAAPDDGVYRLLVSDLTGRGGADYSYRIEARLGVSFGLALKNDPKVNKTRFAVRDERGAFQIDVVAQRSGYDGAIRLNVESETSGWQVFNNIMAAKANETKLYIVPPADWEAAQVAAVRIVGQAVDSPEVPKATMSTIAQCRLAKPAQIYPPAWLDGLIMASSQNAKAEFYTVSQTKPEVTFLRQIGQAQLTLAMQRNDAAFKDVPLTLLLPKVPPGLTAEVKRNGNGPAESYDIVLKGAKDIPAGRHSLRYFTYAELAGSGLAVVSNDVTVNVVDPMAVTISPVAPAATGQNLPAPLPQSLMIVAGMTQKVKVAVTRRGEDRQAVELKFKSLPAGITAPEKTTLAADQNEIEIELTAAADAAPVMFKELVAQATSTTAGRAITGESAAATLEVKKP